jgi:hypothetical protein
VENQKFEIMYIKLKNKKEIRVSSFVSNYSEYTCPWTGKTIKKGKPYFYSYSSGAASGEFCSASALKAASNARL